MAQIKSRLNYVMVQLNVTQSGLSGGGGAMATLDFGRSISPISTKRGKLCPPNITGTPGFSDLPTALQCKSFLTDHSNNAFALSQKNSSIFFKGGLISESFSLCSNSPKKGAKSLR